VKRRITAALLCLAFLTASAAPCFPRRISSPVYAAGYAGEPLSEEIPTEEEESRAFAHISYVTDGVADTGMLLPRDEHTTLLTPSDGDWGFSGPVRKSYSLRTPVDEDPDMTQIFFVAAGPKPGREPEGNELTFTLDLTPGDASGDYLYAEDYRAMQFGIALEDAEGDFPLTAELETSRGTVTADLTLRAHPIEGSGILFSHNQVRSGNGWSVVTLDLTEAEGSLRRLTVRLREDVLPVNTVFSAPLLTTEPTEELIRAGQFSSFRLEAESGSFSGSGPAARTDENGRLLVTGAPATVCPLGENVPCCFEIRTSDIPAANGRLSLGLDFVDGLERVWSSPVRLGADDNVYVVPADILSGVKSFSLLFEGLDPGASFRIESVRIFSGGDPTTGGNEWLGRLERVERSSGGLLFKGSVTADAARSFSSGVIRFCAVPSPVFLNEEDRAFFTAGGSVRLPECAVTVGESKLSTRFEFRFPMPSALPANADSCVYFACVPDPADPDAVMLLSPPRYADIPATDRPVSASRFGLADTFPAGAFESNTFHILTDVSLDRLLSGSGGVSAAYTVPGEDSPRSVFFDASLLSELDRDVQFYRSAGIEVYLRFGINEPIPGLTAQDSLFPDMTSPESAALWCAAVRFFAGRYPDAAGLVLPGPVNDAEAAGVREEEIGRWADALSHLCTLTGSAASSVSPGMAVCVPFDESTDSVCSRLFLALFARRMARTGSPSWTLLSMAGSDGGVTGRLKQTLSYLTDLSLPGPGDLMYVYSLTQRELNQQYAAYLATPASERDSAYVPSEMAVELYRRFSDACGTGARVVFFSPAGLTQRYDHDFYDVLKRGAGIKDAVRESGTRAVSVLPGMVFHDLWDFSDAYYPLDWIPGGGALSCSTELSEAFSDAAGKPSRVLSVSFQEARDGVAGIVMRNLKNTVDLSRVEALTFDFLLEDAGGIVPTDDGGVSVVFIAGTDDKRAEFHADGLSCGEIHRLSCPISDWDDRDRVDFLSIAVYADRPVSLKLSKVTAAASGIPSEELEAVFSPPSEEEDKPDAGWLLPVLVFLAAASFSVFVLLTRRDTEDGADAERTERKERTGRERRTP